MPDEATSLATLTQDCLIDLHLHLDGSISVPMARRLAETGGLELPASDHELTKLLSVERGCRDLNEYLARFDFPAQLLQTEAQVSECVYLLQEELKARGYLYAELRFAPQRSCWQGASQAAIVEAAIDGLGRSDFDAGLIVCCMRGNDTREANLETVRLAHRHLGQGIVALDLAGAEALFPFEGHQGEFALARKLDVPFTIHAGEAAGPESVWAALAAGASRIGHGVRAASDAALLDELARRQVACEFCPTSEIDTCIFESYAEVPLPAFLAAGVPVTINADNMAVSTTDVRSELRALALTFGLADADVEQLLANAARAAFAPPELRERLERRVRDAFAAS